MTLPVLLVEDDIDLANTLLQFLEMEGINCDHAANGQSGLTLAQQNTYGVILLDLNLPRMNGLTLCERLRQSGQDTPVLMLTARDTLDDKLAGFHAGTDDYLVKPFDLDEVLVRVRALAKRRSGQVRKLLAATLEMDLDRKEVFRDGHLLKISPSSWRLLETLMRRFPAVVSRQELEAALWGDNLPDSNSLKVHLHNLRQQLDKGFETGLVETVPGFGFRLKDSN
ncbi:MAG: response regulator transcription factor [Pseudomonadales bacterium]|nr:response regulator transcription factor [Pseudomonadales bacterium]